MRPHLHEHLEFLFITKGSGTFIINGEPISVLPNDLFIAEPNSPHALISDTGVDYYCMLVRPDFFTDEEREEMHFLAHVRADEVINRMFSYLREEFSGGGSMSKMKKKSLVYELVVYLHRKYGAPLISKKSKESRTLELQRLKTVEAYVSENYRNKITVTDLARVLFLSEGHFCRFFKKTVGISAIEYLNIFRVGKAEELLRDTEMSVTEIALQAGFEDANYFTRLFKRITKHTPTEYRALAFKTTAI